MSEPFTLEAIASSSNLTRILDSLKEGIIAHDLRRRIFFFNKEAERITGFSRAEVLGRDCHEVFGSPFCGAKCNFCNGRHIPGEVVEYPLNIRTKSGETRNLEFRAAMVRGDEGEILGVLASFKDLTEMMELRRRSGRESSFSNIVGGDGSMRKVYQQIRDVAQYDFPVHLFGETGTGKELVASAIHNESRRGGAPFVPINCGALPEGLIESELFGHVKGAFSGAIRDKKGRFELADGGTVFLDEVADLPKSLQVKLLRFLQEGKFEKVGGERTVSVDVRVISATNKDLRKEVQNGGFREDLFYRLNVIPIHIPPLRDRRNDVPLLARHFLNQIVERNNLEAIAVSDAALSLLMDYSWPGNVRELQNAVQFAVVHCNGKIIQAWDLPIELREFTSDPVVRGPARKLDAEAVMSAMSRTGGNKAKAARVLGVGRATLYRFFNEHPDLTTS